MDQAQFDASAGMMHGNPGGQVPQGPPGDGGGGAISLSAQAELELELSLRGSLLVQQQRRIVQLEDELQRAWAEIERLRTKLSTIERERQPNEGEDGARAPRYWTPEEHTMFVEAVQRYGWKDVKAISQHVGTRNPTQVRTHAQKLLLRQQKEQAGVMQTQANGRELPPLPPGMLPPPPADMVANNSNSANENGMDGQPLLGSLESNPSAEPSVQPIVGTIEDIPPAAADDPVPVEAS